MARLGTIAGFRGGRINKRELSKKKMEERQLTQEEAQALNEAAQLTCAWETTCQTEEE